MRGIKVYLSQVKLFKFFFLAKDISLWKVPKLMVCESDNSVKMTVFKLIDAAEALVKYEEKLSEFRTSLRTLLP